MKLYLDEDLSSDIAMALRAKGVDAVAAEEAGNRGLADPDQLAAAARDGRCLVTRNARHFTALAIEAIRTERPHAGILLCSPRLTGAEISVIATRLASFAEAHPDGLGPYDIFYL